MSEPRGLGCGATIGVFGVGGILGAVLGGAACGILVKLGDTTQHYHSRFLEERRAVEPALQKDPAFKGIEITEYSAGGIFLIGKVPTDADKKRLEEALTRAIGETRTHWVTLAVSVEKQSPTESKSAAKPHRE
jgi:hypothetical protein